MSDTFGEGQNWFYVREGRRQGPFDRRRLLEALVALEQPEATLVWRSGLEEWTRAGDLKELRDELPPPIPRDAAADAADRAAIAPPPLPTEDEIRATLDTSPEGGTKALAEEQEEDEPEGSAGPPASPGETEEARRRRRRHRKRKHSESLLTPKRLRLLAMFLILALVLWFVLHRQNEMPPGRVILDGAPGP